MIQFVGATAVFVILLGVCIAYVYDLFMRIAHEQAERAMRNNDEYKYPRPLLRGENDE
jgi:hypothetical protein